MINIHRLNVNVAEEVKNKLEDLSKKEGRSISDLIREAIAKLLRERGYLKE
ncbi:plasmid partition protein ParG [Marinitoga lauensis]|uniref:plasmid partition protein ParG n=1 Tax=Marinitoga lauensis TaxID=2201189 RepID=UPI00101319A1|nr:plasmid partition protein ParG [Marinitoga lauensis]